MRAALLQRQVNPLGTVITLPVDGSTPPPLQFILPAQVLHPSLDRPSTSRQVSPPVDYLNLAQSCVSCVVSPPPESGSPPYVPAPLSEPELPDPFLEVMTDAGPPISQTSSKATKNETKPKGKSRKKKTSAADRLKDPKYSIGLPSPENEPALLDFDKPSENPSPADSQEKPKARPRRAKPFPETVIQSPSVTSTLETEPSVYSIEPPKDDDETPCDSVFSEPTRNISHDPELDPKIPLLQSSFDGNTMDLETLPMAVSPIAESFPPCSPFGSEECDQQLEPETLIELSTEPAELISEIIVEPDSTEDAPGDSESNSEPITAVNVSRDDSITDMKGSVSQEAEPSVDDLEAPDEDQVLETKHEKSPELEKTVFEAKKPKEPAKKLRSGKNKSKRKEKAGSEEHKEELTNTSSDSEKLVGIVHPENVLATISLLDEPLDDFPRVLEAPFAQSTTSELGVDQDFVELLERRRQSRLRKSGSLDVPVEKPEADSSSETTGESRDSVKESTSNPETSSQSDADLIELKRGRRAKKLKSAESLEEVKKKSPSPSKAEVKLDTDSSDEAIDKSVEKQPTNPKLTKRKKGKKSDEPEPPGPEVKLKTKSKSEGTLDTEKSDYETCSEKKSDSSIESFPEVKKRQDPNGNFQEVKSWACIVKNDKEPLKPTNSAEDRDSVYESCNDEVPEVDSVAFESSKEDFEEPKVEQGSSSNAEEKTDSGDKDTAVAQTSAKKVRKQKKKRR